MKRVFLAALVTTCLLASCAQLPEFSRIKSPMITLTNVNYREVGIVGLTMETELNIENPNSFPIYIAYVNYALYLDDIKVGYGSRKKRLKIKPYSSKRLEAPIQMTFLDMTASVISAINQKSGGYKIEGEMILRTQSGDKPLPFKKEGTANFLRL